MNTREGRDVADLSPGTVLIAGSTGWRYRVQARRSIGRPCRPLRTTRVALGRLRKPPA